MGEHDDDIQPPVGGDSNPDEGEAAPPPPLTGDEGGGAADSMEQNLPHGLKGGAVDMALGQGTMSEKDEKTFAMLAHILGLIPLLGPLVIWILKRNDSPFVDDQGKEAVSFQFLVVISLVVVGILSQIPFVACFTIFLFPVIWVANAIMSIMAGLKAGDGVAYRYPFALRIL